jgi:hypothetical protein
VIVTRGYMQDVHDCEYKNEETDENSWPTIMAMVKNMIGSIWRTIGMMA